MLYGIFEIHDIKCIILCKEKTGGVKMNLNTLEKENEQLEEEINDVSSC